MGILQETLLQSQLMQGAESKAQVGVQTAFVVAQYSAALLSTPASQIIIDISEDTLA